MQSNRPTPNLDAVVAAGPLSRFVSHLRTLVDEAKVQITDDGLRVRAVDPANVGMIDVTLRKQAFDRYQADSEAGWSDLVEANTEYSYISILPADYGPSPPLKYPVNRPERDKMAVSPEDGIVLGANLDRLADCLSSAQTDDRVTLKYWSFKSVLRVEYGSHSFDVRTIMPNSIRSEPDLPDLDLPVRYRASASALRESIDHADRVSDHFWFKTDGDDAVLAAEGDTDEYERLLNGEAEWVDRASEPTESLYSLDYLKPMMRPFDAKEKITVNHGTEFPLRLSGSIPHVEDDLTAGDVELMLAPRINSD